MNLPAVVTTSAVYVLLVEIAIVGSFDQLRLFTRSEVEDLQPAATAIASAWDCVTPTGTDEEVVVEELATVEEVVVLEVGASEVLLLARSQRNEPMTATAIATL